MSLGEDIADAIPDGVFEYVQRHPRVLTYITGTLVVVASVQLYKTARLHVQAKAFVVQMQKAASEALGG